MISQLIHWVIRFDQFVLNQYADAVDQGIYQQLQDFCRWIGSPVQMTCAYLLIGVYAYIIGGWPLFLLVVMTIVLTNVVNLGIKAMFGRARPESAIFRSPFPFDKYAFPSGHAATTMSLAFSLGLAAGGWVWLLFAWALFMGISRFFAELHHPSDILAGFIVGILSGYFIQAGYLLVWEA